MTTKDQFETTEEVCTGIVVIVAIILAVPSILLVLLIFWVKGLGHENPN